MNQGHPHYLNQLSCGLDLVSLAGEWVTASANTNMFTYEIAPVFILLENVVLRKMREVIGYKGGDSILCPGGTVSNINAVLCARYKHFPECKTKGVHGLPCQPVLFTSEHSHYSIKTAASAAGLGTDNVVEVKTDAKGKMIPEELEKQIVACLNYEGPVKKKPFFVNCTCGTTVLGAFDPVEPIANICAKYGLWLHIDAAWGGGLLLSEKYRAERFLGVERADSVTWNPHKLMGCLLQCSTVHLKEDGILMNCNQMNAEYLFQDDKQYYDCRFDTGDKVIQCGRHNDIFKLWLMWRAKGMSGFRRHIDGLMATAEYMTEQLKADTSGRFVLLWPEPECVNICFWYVPTRLRSSIKSNLTWPSKPVQQDLGRITAQLKSRMMNTGTLMINYQPQGDTPNFFRAIISNPAVGRDDVDFALAELDRLGHDL
ncbi:unnamed protein product [Notodromas monacha]|uniref:Glutamate decarboxylase n=1 Tax=Notodromas monacha TaxID=399045 RepID=A0A7R9BJY5_9CRUS|nr:unnamed protein product [Notodromas monacha]CAG0916617.1 unnamed protein product [Notodromas monacha]